MRVVVTGSRHFSDRERVYRVLDRLHAEFTITLLIHGGASGADTLCGDWANERGVAVKVYKPDWKRYGRGGGPMRNQQMIDEGKPDIGVSFPGGRGTGDMTKRMQRAFDVSRLIYG